MKQKKNKGLLIAIVIVLIIILILLGIIAYLYFFTDMFKSNEQLFSKYASQIVSEKDGFITDNLKQYFEKQKNNPYENTGDMKFNVSIPNTDSNLDYTNNFSITFSGKSDIPNSKIEESIDFNYSDELKIPVTYKSTGNYKGIQSDIIGKNNVVIRMSSNSSSLQNAKQEYSNDVSGENNTQNNTNTSSQEETNTENSTQNTNDINVTENTNNANESENTNKIASDESNVAVEKIRQNVVELSETKIIIEDIMHVYNTYSGAITKQIQDNNITKVEENGLVGYKLILSNEQYKNMIIEILNTLKGDSTTLNKLNKYIALGKKSAEIKEKDIDNWIEEISNNNIIGNENAEITLYQLNGQLTRILFTQGNNKIDVSKSGNQAEITYTISLEMHVGDPEETKFNLSLKYTGLNNLENVNEIYELSMEAPKGDTNNSQGNNSQEIMSVSDEKEIVQTMIADIQSDKLLNGDDSSIISDTDIENILSTGDNENYSNMKLEKEDDKTFKITFINSNDEFIINNEGKITKEPEGENQNTNSEKTDNINYKCTFNNSIKFVSNVEIEELTEENSVILNDRDETYVNDLVDAIKQRIENKDNSFMQELGGTKSDSPFEYITLPIYMISGGTSASEVNQEEAMEFNSKFELYQSTNSKGATVKGLLTVIQNNNEIEQNNKIEEINVDGEEYEVTEQNISFLKSEINVDDDYKIEFEKDGDTGLIYRAVINKK